MTFFPTRVESHGVLSIYLDMKECVQSICITIKIMLGKIIFCILSCQWRKCKIYIKVFAGMRGVDHSLCEQDNLKNILRALSLKFEWFLQAESFYFYYMVFIRIGIPLNKCVDWWRQQLGHLTFPEKGWPLNYT